MSPDLFPGALAVKICGVRDVGTAEAAVRAGASAVGVALAPSRRRVSTETAALIGEAMRQLPEPRPVVGLVVNEDAASMASLVERTGVDVLQLSGDESPDLLATLAVPVVKSIRLRRGQSLDSARQAIEPWFEHRRPVAVVLLDAHVEGQYGGTGHVADWDLAAALAEWYPVMLAGGLTVSNVGEAIRRVRPRGVDVSSGVETDGTKDHAKIRAFIVAARSETSVPSGD